jgi:hypothetical protein
MWHALSHCYSFARTDVKIIIIWLPQAGTEVI